jgi:hypothetical protein
VVAQVENAAAVPKLPKSASVLMSQRKESTAVTDADPSVVERDLLLTQLSALHGNLIRDFMRENEIAPLSGRKEELVDRIRAALVGNDVTWQGLIEYLDRVEPFNKQHVTLYRFVGDAGPDYASADAVKALLDKHGLADVWANRLPLAAPEDLTLSSVGFDDDTLEIYAIGRRTYPERRREREAEISLGPQFETRVYENVAIRSWVRLLWNIPSGHASLQISQLPRQSLYDDVRADFDALIDAWVPVGSLQPLDLGKAVSRLEEAVIEGKGEVRIQSVGHNSHGGLRSQISSGAQGQSVYGESTDYDEALKKLHASGPGAAGSLYFLPAAGGGLAATPLTDEVHVVLNAKENSINFARPTEQPALEHVLRRIRTLAT